MSTSPFPALMLALGALTAPSPAAGGEAVDQDSFAACFAAQSAGVPFSGVAMASKGDRTLFKATGMADPDGTSAIARDTRFRLASVQKLFTKAAIGVLVEQKKVDLDAPIGTYLPGLKPDVAAITVDQLLQHRSGAAPFTNMSKIPAEVRMAYARATSARERAMVVAAQPLGFVPGQKMEYSNGGYQMLGAIIEAVSGKDYGTFLAQALFGPLGMVSTDLMPDARTAVRFTKIQMGGGSFPDWTAAIAKVERPGHPAGDGVSTADDMTRFGRALLGDTLLSGPVKARIFPRKGAEWRLGQSGGTMGTNADFSAFPDSGWIVTVLANYDPPAGELMGEVLRTFVQGGGCKTLRPSDRMSPMDIIRQPGKKLR